jgi:hypothetical protein
MSQARRAPRTMLGSLLVAAAVVFLGGSAHSQSCDECIKDRCAECLKAGAVLLFCELSDYTEPNVDTLQFYSAICDQCYAENIGYCRQLGQTAGQTGGGQTAGGGAGGGGGDPLGELDAGGAAGAMKKAGPNAAPYPPTLLGPPNTYNPPVPGQQVVLQWRNNGDQDGDVLTPSLQIFRTQWDQSQGGWTQWGEIYRNWAEGYSFALTPQNGLIPGACYAWKAFAVDRTGRSNPAFTESDWAVFCAGG